MEHQPVLTEVRSAHRFSEEKLATFLVEKLGEGFHPQSFRQFEGGQSNPTFLLQTRDRQLVLRKQPPGHLLPSAHAVDREYRVMHHLQGTGVPVPRMVLLCEDPEIIGTRFFLMDYVPGRVIVDPRLPGLSVEERKALTLDQIEVLARLHQVDLEKTGLGDFGKSGNYYQRQLSRWTKQYRASQTEDILSMEALISWLPANVPDSDAVTLVHGDYRVGNLVIDPNIPKVAAVLDWELSTLGHPMGDLSYWCLSYHYIHGAGGAVLSDAIEGIPSEAAVLDRYAAITGFHPGKDWPFYLAFTMFRLAAIIQGVVKRGMDGNASSERWASLKDDCRRLAVLGEKLCLG